MLALSKALEQPIVTTFLGNDSVLTQALGRAVYNDVGLQGQHIKIVAELGYSHKAGITGYIFIPAIDKNAYEYFDQLDGQKIATNNPFVQPVFL